jgi:DNA-binding MarR family transcriptional regulator
MTTSPRLLAELKQRRPFPTPAEEAAVALMRTTDLLQRRISLAIEPAGITPQQYNVLRILRGSHPEPLPTLEIALRMIEQAPGITRLLDRLESKQLVRRERCREDRRQVLCRISDRGLAVLAELDRPVSSAIRGAFRKLGRVGALQLIELLDGLREELVDHAPAPPDASPPD